MGKKEKKDPAKEQEGQVTTPKPPQTIDPSSPPGKGRNKDYDSGTPEQEKAGDKKH
jgi:hypothetical protein